MARIPPLTLEATSPMSRALWEAQVRVHKRMTATRATMAHSATALAALYEWAPLRDRVQGFLDVRGAALVAHAVAVTARSVVDEAGYRKTLQDAGADPDALVLSTDEQQVVTFATQIARDPHGASDAQLALLAAQYTPTQLVDLVAYVGMTMATCVFNVVLGVELEPELQPYARKSAAPPSE